MNLLSVEMTVNKGEESLRWLQDSEEVLQICYWFQGEGLGERFTADGVLTFLNSPRERVIEIFQILADEGDLEQAAGGDYTFSVEGKRKAGRLFYENFTELQLGSHGECNAGCCDNEEECDHDQDQPSSPVLQP